MWVSLVSWVIAAAAGPAAGVGSAGVAPSLPPPVATRQDLFAIPFHIARSDMPAHEPVEVQLHVSGDRGAHWQLYSKVEPARQQFLFRAGGDGEFWFVVRTVDRSGQVRPEGFAVPGLRVVVDTVPPKLQLSAVRGRDGQITARWHIEDLNPRPESLTVQYRTADDAPWQPVAIDRQSLISAGAVQAGEVTWWPPVKSGEIQVRADVSDAAGNASVSHARIKLDGASAVETARTVPAIPAAADASPWRAGTNRTPVASWPAARTTATPLSGLRGDDNAPDPVSRAGAPLSQGGSAASESPTRSVPAAVNPAIQDRYVPPDRPSEAPSILGLPRGERPRMVNSRAFDLEYDIDAAAAAGVAGVELWGTRDGGQTWKNYASDSEHHGPLRVTVDEEGVYGFRLVLRTAAGVSGAPQPGDLPEVWIGVDLTKPTAHITLAQAGSGAELGKLIIGWQAADNMLLAARPITLSFRERLGEPWTTLAAGLENTGRYAWPLDGRLPEQIFLRLEACDEAGNQSVDETSEPITLDRSRRPITIRDIHPTGPSSRANPEQRFVR